MVGLAGLSSLPLLLCDAKQPDISIGAIGWMWRNTGGVASDENGRPEKGSENLQLQVYP
jgi:hypothetical protein